MPEFAPFFAERAIPDFASTANATEAKARTIELIADNLVEIIFMNFL